VLLFCFTRTELAFPEEQAKKRKIQKKVITDIYDQLKANVVEVKSSLTKPLSDDTFNKYEPAKTENDSKEKLKSILKKIDELHQSRTEYQCILGLELANLKYLHLRNKCDTCSKVSNILHTVNCKTCTSSKCNNLTEFKKQSTHILKKSNDYVNFYINLAIIAASYPMFMYNTLPTREIKKNIKYFSMQMSKDIGWWQ